MKPPVVESRARFCFRSDAEIYKLPLHPMMPRSRPKSCGRRRRARGERSTLLCHAAWPVPEFEDAEAAGAINWLVDLVSGIRSLVRSNNRASAAANRAAGRGGSHRRHQERLVRRQTVIIGALGNITLADTAPQRLGNTVLVRQRYVCRLAIWLTSQGRGSV